MSSDIKEWKRQALASIQATQGMVTEVFGERILSLISAYEKQAEVIVEAKKALEEYANCGEARYTTNGLYPATYIASDYGSLARKVLNRISELEGKK